MDPLSKFWHGLAAGTAWVLEEGPCPSGMMVCSPPVLASLGATPEPAPNPPFRASWAWRISKAKFQIPKLQIPKFPNRHHHECSTLCGPMRAEARHWFPEAQAGGAIRRRQGPATGMDETA